MIGTGDVPGGAITQGFQQPNRLKVRLNIAAFLEGAYNNGTGLMSDALRSSGLVPIGEPYTALGYSHVGGGGGESIAPIVLATTGSDAIVDWVLVELRDPALSTNVLATRSALLKRNGAIVDLDGASPVGFNMPSGSYFVAVRHRNHLGVMTQGVHPFTHGLVTTLDLTSSGTLTFGTNGRKSIAGAFPAQVLWAGDVTFNNQIKYAGSGNDRDPILTAIGGSVPTNTVNGYHQADVNMNGQVRYAGSGNDRDPILTNVGGTVPTNTRNAQLP